MKIEAATTKAVLSVATRMRQKDAEEFLAVSRAETKDELATQLATLYGGHPEAMCAWLGDDPVAIGAMIEGRPGVITLMFFATDRFEEVAVPLTRFIRQRLFPRYWAVGIHRMEAISMTGHGETHRWMRTLGFTQETGPLLGYGRNKETFIQFAWVADDVRQTGP